MSQTQKPYVQFSKKIVVAVFAAVTLISSAGLVFSWFIGDASQMSTVIKHYIEYAMVVFAAYSGNSAVEKWLVHKANAQEETDACG